MQETTAQAVTSITQHALAVLVSQLSAQRASFSTGIHAIADAHNKNVISLPCTTSTLTRAVASADHKFAQLVTTSTLTNALVFAKRLSAVSDSTSLLTTASANATQLPHSINVVKARCSISRPASVCALNQQMLAQVMKSGTLLSADASAAQRFAQTTSIGMKMIVNANAHQSTAVPPNTGTIRLANANAFSKTAVQLKMLSMSTTGTMRSAAANALSVEQAANALQAKFLITASVTAS